MEAQLEEERLNWQAERARFEEERRRWEDFEAKTRDELDLARNAAPQVPPQGVGGHGR